MVRLSTLRPGTSRTVEVSAEVRAKVASLSGQKVQLRQWWLLRSAR